MHQSVLHPVVAAADVEAVAEAASNPGAAMMYAARLRDRVLEVTGAPDCVLTCNCTQALRMSIALLGRHSGSLAVIPDLTFVATAHAAMLAGVRPWLVDIDPQTFHLNVGMPGWPKAWWISAVVPVELLGTVLDDGLVRGLAKLGAPIIVDAAQSLGATKWRNEYTAMCVSFAANKIVHGHQGGAILMRREHGDAIRKYIRHGRVAGCEGYRHDSLGENLAMNPLGAALAWSQMRRLDSIMETRNRQRTEYAAVDAGLYTYGAASNGWLHIGDVRKNRDRPCCQLWEPLHTMPHIAGPSRGVPYREDDFPVASHVYETVVALPSSDDLNPATIKETYK